MVATNSAIREKAVALRKLGRSYPEIIQEVKVAKSTLWSWFKDIEFSDEIKEYFREKKVQRAHKASNFRHKYRVEKTENIYRLASQEIGALSKREQWLIGVVMYWAEGSKEKDYYPSSVLKFSNSDPNMIRFFQNWLLTVGGVKNEDIGFELYLHETRKDCLLEILMYWAGILNCQADNIRVYYKMQKLRTNRINTGDNYRGLVRITVRRSSGLVRKVGGWVQGLGCGFR